MSCKVSKNTSLSAGSVEVLKCCLFLGLLCLCLDRTVRQWHCRVSCSHIICHIAGVSATAGEFPRNKLHDRSWNIVDYALPIGWFIMESPIKMDDLGIPLFLETPIYSMFNSIVQLHPKKYMSIPSRWLDFYLISLRQQPAQCEEYQNIYFPFQFSKNAPKNFGERGWR